MTTNANGAGRPRKAPGKKGRASKATQPALGQIAQQVEKDLELEGVDGISSSNNLKIRWSRFAEAYFESGNATESYKYAGYMPSTEQAAHSGASRLLTHPFVQAYLRRLHLMSVPETDINEPVREEDKEILVASEDEIVKKEKFKLTTRMKGYIVVLTILIGVLISMLFLRNEVEATVLRMNGQMFEHKGENISNVFTYKVVNKTSHDYDELTLKLASHQGEIKIVGGNIIKLPAQKLAKGTLFIEIPSTELKSDKTEITIEVYHKDKMIEKTKTNFMSPRAF
jgi:hypothetical protein